MVICYFLNCCVLPNVFYSDILKTFCQTVVQFSHTKQWWQKLNCNLALQPWFVISCQARIRNHGLLNMAWNNLWVDRPQLWPTEAVMATKTKIYFLRCKISGNSEATWVKMFALTGASIQVSRKWQYLPYFPIKPKHFFLFNNIK